MDGTGFWRLLIAAVIPARQRQFHLCTLLIRYLRRHVVKHIIINSMTESLRVSWGSQRLWKGTISPLDTCKRR